MTVEERLAALEARLRTAEDHLAILNLLNSYGPLVDSGSDQDAVALWIEGGGYNFTRPQGGAGRLEAPEELSALYRSGPHKELITTGSAHITLTPKITISGNDAAAVGYSMVVEREGKRWFLERASINHWTLTRTSSGWRIIERFNRTLIGSAETHELMRRVLSI